ncbi:hypothetical protein GUJ93_ZPchr0320g33494 [Zizania palustris]|uniref:Cytochrome P450 n=1 Tax=Zizania palustris TaxID=103762 RepID=A0A8J5RBX9_ZIZPA|nr:hypothetical protein GUJ93_ZPchr0320g33494 [Zizania palustris]
MDHVFACCVLPAVFAILLLLRLLPLKLAKSGGGGDGLRLPPGPWRLPVVGSLHHMMGKRLAHRTMADLARRLDAPLMYLKLGEVPVVVASSPAAAREIMRTHDLAFAGRSLSPTARRMRPGGDGLVFSPYGPLWRQLRKIVVVELLSARRVRSFHGVREEERITELVSDSSVRAMIGDRFDRRDEFLEEEAKQSNLLSVFSLDNLFPSSRLASAIGGTVRRAEANRRKLYELMDCAIRQHEERRAATVDGAGGGMEDEKDQDILDELLTIQKDGGLESPITLEQIRAIMLDLFTAGTETSANTLQWAMSELVKNPRVMKKAQAELRDTLREKKPAVTEDDLCDLKYLKLVVMETLRLHPVAPLLLPRECLEPCKVMGYDIARGTTVLVNVWSINRDPRYWGDDAEEFVPERFESGAVNFKGMDFEFIPFGSGRRMCPGVAFAEASMELPLAALLYHFDWELPHGTTASELDMAEQMGLTSRRKNDLHLHPILRVNPTA